MVRPHVQGPRITRRKAMRLLGFGAGAGVLALVDPLQAVTSAAFQPGRSARLPSFPSGAIIRTLLNDISPEAMGAGAVLFHEHLSARWGRPQHFTDDVGLIAEEVRSSGTDGIACIVDAGHPDIGRNIDALRRIATESGIPIVASGGYYTQRLYPADLRGKSEEGLVEDLVRDAASQRFGAFGEIGQELGQMTAEERKVFQAVGRAHVRTGLPIFTHNAYTGKRAGALPVPPDSALRQLDLLESTGVKPQHVALGHMCCLHDPTTIVAQQVAKRGAFVGFDRVTLEGILPDADRVVMVMSFVDSGYADQLLLSSDFSQEKALKKNGGPGIAQTVTVFGPKLLKAGLPEATLHQILVDNPKRFLAFVPNR
jgi:phosphotriesterase-related protein